MQPFELKLEMDKYDVYPREKKSFFFFLFIFPDIIFPSIMPFDSCFKLLLIIWQNRSKYKFHNKILSDPIFNLNQCKKNPV